MLAAGFDWELFIRVLTLRDHNTQVVVTGVTLIGLTAGVVGTFAYLRKRSMMGDALSHATLPGVAAAFLITANKQLGVLLLGATVTGVLGILCVVGIRRYSRIKEDAAIGIVLSVFFGAGAVLLSVIQSLPTGSQAGLNSFIYGKTAAMLDQDARLIRWTAVLVLAGALLLYKEFRVVCFDQHYAASQGWPVVLIDLLMMALVVLTTVIGLQAVGLLLIVAMLIIPAAAARFWTDSLSRMTFLAGIFGAVGAWVGAVISALVDDMPTGAIIVLATGAVFFMSMLFSPHRGVFFSLARQTILRRKIADQHLLRGLAEHEEQYGEEIRIRRADLQRKRGWSGVHLGRVLRRCIRRGEVRTDSTAMVALTVAGRASAKRILRNHRLWEMYLIQYADIAPSHVDRDADEVEHVLSEEIIHELERALAEETRIPPSPHLEGMTA